MADKSDYTRESLLYGSDVLVIYRDPITPPKPAPGQPGTHSNFTPHEPEIFIAVLSDSHIVAFNGHDQPAAFARVLGHGVRLDGLQGCRLHVSPMKRARAGGPGKWNREGIDQERNRPAAGKPP